MLASVLLKEGREWTEVKVFHSSIMWFTIKPFLFLVPTTCSFIIFQGFFWKIYLLGGSLLFTYMKLWVL